MSNSIPLAEHLCYALYSASIAVNRLYKPILDELGITYPQYLVLCVLWETGDLTISDIAQRLALEPSTITPLVKRLEHADLVTRQRGSEDERYVTVSPTAKAHGIRTKAGRLTATLLKRSGLTVDGILSLNRDVRGLRSALTKAEQT